MRISDWSSDVCSSDLREGQTMTAERLDMPVDGEADRRAQALQRAILDHLLAGREYELQFRSIDDVDLGRPVAILFRDRWKERRDSHAKEGDARAEMPVKIVAIDADADGVLPGDRICALQPVLRT